MEKQEILIVIDEIIERANEIKKLQKKIGAGLICDGDSILVYHESNLLEYAEIVGEQVKESGYISSNGKYHIGFLYNGYEFSSYITAERLEEIREKVLPPTKVTEPNQNT